MKSVHSGGPGVTGAPSLDGSACEPLPLPDGSLSSISRASAENTSGDTLRCRGLAGALPHSGLTGARRAAFQSSGRVPELSIFTVANFCVRARIWWNEQKVAPREQHYASAAIRSDPGPAFELAARWHLQVDQFDDFQIEDMYHEIFLGTVAGREQAEVYK